MINRNLSNISYEIDEIVQSKNFSYKESCTMHENFVLFLKQVFNEVPSQYLESKLISLSPEDQENQFYKIEVELDADCQFETAQRIMFAFHTFLAEYLPVRYNINSIKEIWT